MHRKLAQFGFQENQIEAMIQPNKAEDLPTSSLPNRPLITSQPQAPTYIEIYKDHIDIETLRYFGLPWEQNVVRLHRTKSLSVETNKR